VLFKSANVPAVQFEQKDTVSKDADDEPMLHFEQSCELDASGTRKLYSAVIFFNTVLLMLMNVP
jgi:hypothetical protein